jgi:hypothetical protein
MGRYDAMQVTLTQIQSTLFMGALVSGTITLKASAVALLTPCTYLTGSGTLQQYSLDMYSGSYNGNTCPVLINGGLRSQAYSQMSPEAITTTGPASSTSISGFVFPGPAYGAQAFSDPLAAVTSPSFGACSPGHTSAYNLSGGTATLNPGTYCKGLNFTNATVVMNPGLYIITGGAVWSNSNVSGTGVTLFFTQGGGGSYAGLKIQNSSNVTLSAPTVASNGSIAAILVFSDRNWTHTNPQDFYITDSTVLGDGIWYLKNAGLNVWMSGTFTGNNYLGIVADNIFSGGTIITPLNNYSNVQGGNPFRTTAPLVQ